MASKRPISTEEAERLGATLGVDWTKIPVEQVRRKPGASCSLYLGAVKRQLRQYFNLWGRLSSLPIQWRQAGKPAPHRYKNLKEEYHEIQHQGPGGRQVSRSKG
jgi:hypothetical protein